MSHHSSLPKSSRHLLLYDEDWEWIYDNYGPYSSSRFGVGNAICEIVHKRVLQLKARVQSRLDTQQGQGEAEMENADD